MEAQDVVEPVVQVAFGDEMRAYDTIVDAINGRPVSAGDALEAAFTVGSDALMLIPGVGAGIAAAKLGSRAAKTAKAAATLSKSVQKGRKATSASIKATERPNAFNKARSAVASKASRKADAKYAKALKAVKKDKKLVARRDTPDRSAVDAYRADSANWAKKQAKMKAKKNSPKRKKMRKLGRYGNLAGTLNNFNYLEDSE